MLRAYRPLATALLTALLLAGCTLSSGPTEEVIPQISGAPVARITAPLPNTTYLEGVGVNVQIAISNAGNDIDRVEMSLDGVTTVTLPSPNPSGAPAFGVTQTFVAEGIGTHTVEVRVYREDGTSSAPVSVSYAVVSEAQAQPTPTPTNTVPPTAQPTATVPPTTPPTTDSAGAPVIVVSTTETASPAGTTVPVIARFEGAVNIRRGPSTNFVPPLGTFNAGQSTTVLALNTDGTWLKVSIAGGEGWVLRELVKTEGPVDSLPREAGPPIPTLAPATNTPQSAAVPTTTPITGPNLVVVGFELRQINGNRPVNDISINEPSIAFARIRNAGDQPAGGFVALLTIINTADNSVNVAEALVVAGLAPGEEQLIQIGFTDSAGQNAQKSATIRLDENNQVAETNEDDNRSNPITYTLR